MTTTNTNVMVSDVIIRLAKHTKYYQAANDQLHGNSSNNRHRNNHKFNYGNCNELAQHDRMVLDSPLKVRLNVAPDDRN